MPHRNPIIGHHSVALDVSERRRLEALAQKLLASEPTLAAYRPFGERVAPGLGAYPNLVIEDHSAIALFETAGDHAYAYRGLLLAGDGDWAVVETCHNPAFEAYCRDHLGLGEVTVVAAPNAAGARSVTARAADNPDIVSRIAALARQAGGLNIVPYMGIGHAWRLAGRVSETADVPVYVAAPPPRLTRRVNDKLWFAERVREVLGAATEPRSFAAFGPAGLANLVRTLSARNASVVVKVPDSASSAGNIVVDRSRANRGRLSALHDHLMTRLSESGWRGPYPLMVAAWEQPMIASPSAQIWIPDPREGAPIVEGIFDQAIVGSERAFAGAAPSTLSATTLSRIADGVARLAFHFQSLGYYGRCSFDAILVGATEADAALHWIECNGRWGGVSIPLTLANRLTGDWARQCFVVTERRDLARKPRPFDHWLARLSDHLYDARRADTAGVVILSPGRLEDGSGFEIMVVGADLDDARRRAEAVLPLLTGPDA